MSASSRNASPFGPVVGTRPADEIMAQIRAKLASQELRAGDRLPSERELSEQFKVSRNSVRQALRSLAELGLLDIRKGAFGGAFIQEGGGGAVKAGLADLYALGTIRPEHVTEVRLLLSVAVARLACERCTDEEIDALAENVAQAEQAAQREDIEARSRINFEFNRMLARMTRNPLLVALSDAVMDVIGNLVAEIGLSPDQTVMPMRHRLLTHLRRRDADAAAQEMQSHLLRLNRRYLAAVRKRSADASAEVAPARKTGAKAAKPVKAAA